MLLDVSQQVSPETAGFPGDEPFSCGWTGRLESGFSCNVGWVKTSTHVGTHVDAPYHFDAAGKHVGELPLDAFVGPCLVIDAVGRRSLDEDLIPGADLPPRVLFRTRERADPRVFASEFPTLTPGAIKRLARAGVKLVGVDVPSVDPVDSKELAIHHALAAAGIVNIENLVLDQARAGNYELLAAPVNWMQMDAAPVRALLRS